MILLRSTWSLEILKTVSLWSLLLSVQVLVSELCCSDSLLSSALRVRLTVRLMQPQSTFSNYVIHEFPGHRDKVLLAWYPYALNAIIGGPIQNSYQCFSHIHMGFSSAAVLIQIIFYPYS
eukprot:jgi/Botrbrau1/15680/Bobra.4_1s0059.1